MLGLEVREKFILYPTGIPGVVCAVYSFIYDIIIFVTGTFDTFFFLVSFKLRGKSVLISLYKTSELNSVSFGILQL